MGDTVTHEEAQRRIGAAMKMILQVEPIDKIAEATGFTEEQLLPVIRTSALSPFNQWWCMQPAGRRTVLHQDKWMMAQAAFEGGRDWQNVFDIAAVQDALRR